MSATSLKIVAAGAAISAALAASGPAAAETAAPLMAETSVASLAAGDVVEAPKLTSIDYVRLYRRLVQAGMLSQVLAYKLTVDADGKPVGCSFSRDFRMLVTERDVCRAFMRSTAFAPARDAQGNPVAGTYEDEIEVASFFQPNR